MANDHDLLLPFPTDRPLGYLEFASWEYPERWYKRAEAQGDVPVAAGERVRLVLRSPTPLESLAVLLPAYEAGLEELELQFSDVTTSAMEELPSLTRLTHLSLGYRQTDERTLSIIGAMPWLLGLRLESSTVTDASFLRLHRLTGLTELSLRGTAITDASMPHIGTLTRLRILDLGGTPITDKGMKHLDALTDLWDLDVAETGVGDGWTSTLRTFARLEWLSLWDAAVTDALLPTIGRLANLVVLNLGDTMVTDDGLRHLARLHSIEDLTLYGTSVTRTGINALQDALPNCDIGWEDAAEDTAGENVWPPRHSMP